MVTFFRKSLSRRSALVGTAVLGIGAVLWASPAQASEEGAIAAMAAAIGFSPMTSTSTTTTSIAAGITGLGLTTGMLLTGGNEEKEKKREFVFYIRNNAPELQQDIVLGAGATARDLAGMFGIPEDHLPSFGRALQRRRKDLLPLTDPHRIDEERAVTFVRIVRDAMLEDPDLVDVLRASDNTTG